MDDDAFTNYRLLKIQHALEDANRDAKLREQRERQDRNAAAQLAEMQKKNEPEPIRSSPPPPKRFNLVKQKQELSEILRGDDPLKLPILREFRSKFQTQCEIHAVDINNYIDREITEMEKSMRETVIQWERRYNATAAKKKAEIELAKQEEEKQYQKRVEQNRAREKQRRSQIKPITEAQRAARIKTVKYQMALAQAISIERDIVTDNTPMPPEWAATLLDYIFATTIFPIDTLIVSAGLAASYIAEMNTTVITIWIGKIMIGIPLWIWKKIAPKVQEKTTIRNYRKKRAKAFFEAGIPASIANTSHDQHIAERDKYPRTNTSMLQRELEHLENRENPYPYEPRQGIGAFPSA